MKIGFVFDDSLDAPDGVQQYILMLAREFTRRGHNVHFLVGETHRDDIADTHSLSKNVMVKFNQNRMRIPLPADRRKIRDILTREKFDVLHVQAPYSPFLAGRVINAAPANTRIVATWHITANSWLVSTGGKLLGILNRRTLKSIDSHIAVSTAAASFAHSAFGVKSVVVPCPIDLEKFRSAEPIRKSGWKQIVFLGRLVPRKGVDKLLNAIKFAEENSLLPDKTRVVIGGDGPMRAELQSFVKQLKTPVDFIGAVAEQPKPDFLAGADVAVFPAIAGETFGIVLTEAMAAGANIVLAGDNPGYRSTMADNDDVLFDPFDPTATAVKIARALTDKKYITQIHKWQQKHVEQFDVRTVADRILAIYDTIKI